MGTKVNFGTFSQLVTKIEKQLNLQNELRWRTIFSLGFLHIFGMYWSYYYAFPAKWQTIAFAIFMYFTSGTGITCGVHRLWAHKAYKARLPLRILLMVFYSTTGQNSIYKWVRDHRVHHKFSDTETDPHNVNRGFWFAHIGWLCMKKNSHVMAKGLQIDMSDIESDPVTVFEHKYSDRLSLVFGFILPTLTGVLLWGEAWKCAVAWQCFIRIVCVLHAELSVNSLAHIYGYKPYNKDIHPAQNLFVSLLTVGEGWHNYHHMFPYDYKAAETFVMMNWSTLLIELWAKMGLAYDLKEGNPQSIEALKKRGDDASMSHKS